MKEINIFLKIKFPYLISDLQSHIYYYISLYGAWYITPCHPHLKIFLKAIGLNNISSSYLAKLIKYRLLKNLCINLDFYK